MKIFSSGSCRLLTTINNGYNKIIPIHSMYIATTLLGINFIGKLHNTKQHIQFINFLKNHITIPDTILSKFLSSYSDIMGPDDKSLIPTKLENIKKEFDNCKWYIFEICSLKLYKNNNFDVQHELTNEYNCILQTKEELLEDLYTLKKLIPNKKILFQTHFRPNIIYDDPSRKIEQREIIYDVINNFCKKMKILLYMILVF